MSFQASILGKGRALLSAAMLLTFFLALCRVPANGQSCAGLQTLPKVLTCLLTHFVATLGNPAPDPT